MNPWRQDPGPCPVCGREHSACTTDSGPVTIVQLPARDAAAATSDVSSPTFSTSETAPPAPAELSTKTYRGVKGRR